MIIPTANQDLYGKTVGEMVNDLQVSTDGAVTGMFNYVTGYTGFNGSNASEQEGYFFPFHLTKGGATMTFVKNGQETKKNIPFESDNVFKVIASDRFGVLVDGALIMEFNFSSANFAEKKTAKLILDSSKDTKNYTEENLTGMTVNKIKELAFSRGYSITKIIKADVIAEFLIQQG